MNWGTLLLIAGGSLYFYVTVLREILAVVVALGRSWYVNTYQFLTSPKLELFAFPHNGAEVIAQAIGMIPEFVVMIVLVVALYVTVQSIAAALRN